MIFGKYKAGNWIPVAFKDQALLDSWIKWLENYRPCMIETGSFSVCSEEEAKACNYFHQDQLVYEMATREPFGFLSNPPLFSFETHKQVYPV